MGVEGEGMSQLSYASRVPRVSETRIVSGCRHALGWTIFAAGAAGLIGCTTLPEPSFKKYSFPKGAYVDPVVRPYETIGYVRSKVDFPTLDAAREEEALCRNYYNKAVAELLKHAREKKADAVIDVRSVVFMQDGSREVYKTPECSDDGEEGQILLQGVAVKWVPEPKAPEPSAKPSVDPRDLTYEDDGIID